MEGTGAIDSVVSLTQVKEDEVVGGGGASLELHGEFQFKDGGAGAAMFAKAMEVVVESDGGVEPRVDDFSCEFPKSFEESNTTGKESARATGKNGKDRVGHGDGKMTSGEGSLDNCADSTPGARIISAGGIPTAEVFSADARGTRGAV